MAGNLATSGGAGVLAEGAEAAASTVKLVFELVGDVHGGW